MTPHFSLLCTSHTTWYAARPRAMHAQPDFLPLRSAVAATIVEIVGAAAAVAAAAAAQHEDQEQEQDIAITASTTEHVCEPP